MRPITGRSLHLALRVLPAVLLVGTAQAQIQPGEAAPDFTLQNLQGTAFKLSDLRGKVVLLDLIGWGCPPCIQAGPAVEQIWRDFEPTDAFQALALEMWNGRPTEVQSFIDATGVTYPVLVNAGFLQSTSWYGLRFDNFVVVDPDGIVRYTSADEPFGSFNDAAIRAAIEAHLPVDQTWSGIKGLYR